jgi:hypothetical protein
MRYCTECGHQIAEAAQFCSACGAPQANAPRAASAPVYDEEQESRGSFIKWIVLVLALVVLYFTNPDEAKHKAAVQDVIGSFKNELGEDAAFTNFILDLGLSLSSITVDNYYFFSLTRMTNLDGSNIVGIGILGHVFVKE